MKTILCYGDSNTWGYAPGLGGRLDHNSRWAGVLRNTLGESYWVIEEGLSGRTTVWDDPIEGYKSGKQYLIPCLESHKPLDLVVLLLGTNDLKKRFSVSAYDIAAGVSTLVNIVFTSTTGTANSAPQVLLIAPPPVAKLTKYAEMFEGAEAKSLKLGEHYKRVAGERGCAFLDASTVMQSSDLDGIHWEVTEHHKLGLAVAEQVKRLLG